MLRKMLKRFRNLIGPAQHTTLDLSPPVPNRLTYVVGDIHGCSALLDTLIDMIRTDQGDRSADWVFVGDYVDRGPDSAGVLRRLRALSDDPARRVTCLMGNHEAMLLQFLKTPTESAEHWLLNGGLDTLSSFHVDRVAGSSPVERHEALAQELRRALPPGTEDWLSRLPMWWQSGNLAVVHALTDGQRPLDEQPTETLLWARPGKRLQPRGDGLWVAHGHTVTPEPAIRAGHIAVDTGAFRSGVLTAAAIDKGDIRFLSTKVEHDVSKQWPG
ncbi:metallophosphoesterase family protein [Actibacterium ureilyticum]|uniref:metallophosphoesterase family protein n=1 Tax=Actibacterium ureilyticum TaxID=1590614 RepID=UPI000BAAEE8D|nr:metallophosphoesterase family protein [Actibacterium ureilyticum]